MYGLYGLYRLAIPLLLILCASSFAAAERISAPRVLVLFSYHRGMEWEETILTGIEESLRGTGTVLDFAYMDTKYVEDEPYLNELAALYRRRFADRRHRLLIAVDDAAFTFLLARRRLFHDAPIVFCGVNHLGPHRLRGHRGVTGVVETIDAAGSVALGLTLHPRTTTLAVVNDNSLTGRNNLPAIDTLRARFPRLALVHTGTGTAAGLARELQTLPASAIVLLLTFNQDSAGQKFSYPESAALVRQATALPVYGVWDFLLGHGIVGGRLTGGQLHGRTAGGIAARILAGENPDDIPVIGESPTRTAVDARELARLEIDHTLLPPDCELVNQPSLSFSETVRMLLVIILCAMLVMVAILAWRLRRRSRSTRRLYRRNSRLERKVARRTALLEEKNAELRMTLAELERDAEAGRMIQFQLLPENDRQFGEFLFQHCLHPSRFMSGDFLDYFRIDDNNIGFYAADVSGHGLPSAFITVFLKSLFDQYRERFRQGNDRILLDPAGLLDTLNMRILDQQINKHLTLFYGIIEPAPGLLHYANGGQFPFPLLITPDSTACLEKNSPPLGLFPNVAYETVHITLPPACRILIPSDGILELLAGESLADKEALLTELVRGEENPAETLCRTLHLDERPVLPDDVTILSIKRGAVWNPASTSMPGTTTSVS